VAQDDTSRLVVPESELYFAKARKIDGYIVSSECTTGIMFVFPSVSSMVLDTKAKV